MRTEATALAAALASALLAGCYTIDEGDVFRPPAASTDRAASLTMRGEAELRERFGAEVSHSLQEFGGHTIAVTMASIPSASPPGYGRPLVVSCSGNAADRQSSGTSYAAKLLPYGDAVLWDYPGYGDSGGKARVADVEAAARGMVDWLDEDAGERPVVLWGHSLGGFVCAQMVSYAAQTKTNVVDAIVLETTARNVAEVGRVWKPWWLPVRVRANGALEAFDTANALTDFDGEVLVLGAGRDGVLPVELHRSLAQALPGATYLEMPEATHYSAGFDPRAVAAVREMLDGL